MNDTTSTTSASTLSLFDLSLCPVKIPDGIYSFPSYPYGVLNTALIEHGRLASLVSNGEGQVILNSDRAITQVVMDVRAALSCGEAVSYHAFTLEPDAGDHQSAAWCETCGVSMLSTAGLYCRACQDSVSLWNDSADSLEALLSPLIGLWAESFRNKGMTSPDLKGALETTVAGLHTTL